MATAPSLTPPREGELIDGGQSAYVKRQSAETQARFWNEVIADDPVFGPSSGFMVGVGPRMDGRYPLVWTRHEHQWGAWQRRTRDVKSHWCGMCGEREDVWTTRRGR